MIPTPYLIYEAKGFWARLYGWHCFAKQHPGQCLYLSRCQAVHSFGLPVAIWILFVDRQGKPMIHWYYLKPNRIRWCKGAFGVIETTEPCNKKRHQIQAALLATEFSELKAFNQWEVDCFGRKYCEK